MTRSDSVVNESALFVIGNSCKLHHLTIHAFNTGSNVVCRQWLLAHNSSETMDFSNLP